MNVFEVVPAATVTDAGTVNTAFVFVSATKPPPVGAAPLRVTVHVALAELPTVEGLHVNPVTVGKGGAPPVTVPPVPDRLRLLPAPDTAMALAIPIDVVLIPAATVRLITATVPFEILMAFTPEARQVYAPEAGIQLNVFEAFVAAVPALAEMAVTSLAGYVRVHCKAAGSLPTGDVKFRFSATVPSEPAVPDITVNVSV